MSDKLRELLKEVRTENYEYSDKLDSELKEVKDRLNTLLSYIRNYKSRYKKEFIDVKGKTVKPTIGTKLTDFN